jgi:hypothetical protein
MKTRRLMLGLMPLVGFLLFGFAAFAASDEETSLFDFKGRATAYIAEDKTIYLWDGKPVAYLDGDAPKDGLDIYGFNGKHLGWFKRGILYDHDGKVVGGIKATFMSLTELEPLKGLKELTPLKNLKELKPLKPLFTKEWAELPLKYFLNQGVN